MEIYWKNLGGFDIKQIFYRTDSNNLAIAEW